MFDNHPVLVTAGFAGLSWVDKIDVLLRWGAAITAIVLGIAKLYELLRK